jgi:hypothetical protein
LSTPSMERGSTAPVSIPRPRLGVRFWAEADIQLGY